MFDLHLFFLADGTETGIGTVDEFNALVAQGVLPEGCYSRAITAAEVKALLA